MTVEMTVIILAMTAMTYPMRLLPALLLARVKVPQSITDCMQLIPVCIMTSMIVIDIFADFTNAIWRLLALLPVLVVAYVSGSIGAGVLVGVLGYSAMHMVT